MREQKPCRYSTCSYFSITRWFSFSSNLLKKGNKDPPSLKKLLLIILIPLFGILLLAVLVGLLVWKVAQSRRREIRYMSDELGDMDIMLKAAMVGDNSLDVSKQPEYIFGPTTILGPCDFCFLSSKIPAAGRGC